MVQTKWISAFHLHVLKDGNDKLDDFILKTPELDDSDLYSTLTFSISDSSEENKIPREKKIGAEKRFKTEVKRTKTKL